MQTCSTATIRAKSALWKCSLYSGLDAYLEVTFPFASHRRHSLSLFPSLSCFLLYASRENIGLSSLNCVSLAFTLRFSFNCSFEQTLFIRSLSVREEDSNVWIRRPIVPWCKQVRIFICECLEGFIWKQTTGERPPKDTRVNGKAKRTNPVKWTNEEQLVKDQQVGSCSFVSLNAI